MKIKKNIQSMHQKKWCEEKFVDLLLIGEERKTHVLLKDLIIFIYDHNYIMGKIIFVVLLYKLLVQKKYENVILKAALKLMANKEL